MRLVFLGSPESSVPPLHALVEAGHDIALVVTQPDRKRGRGGALTPSPVKRAAEALGLPVATPSRAREVVDDVRATGAELGVVVAFGQLLPPVFLDALPLGFVNLHFSLLPRWRGAAPVERAILAGDVETGVCIMRLDEGLDTGPVYECARTAIAPDETAGELMARLVGIGAGLLVRVLPQVLTAAPHEQVGEATYAEKLTVDEFALDPRVPARDLARLVRAGSPRPGAWCTVKGRRLKVLRASPLDDPSAAEVPPGSVVWPGALLGTSEGALRLEEVQPEGRKLMTGDAWLAGFGEKQLQLAVS